MESHKTAVADPEAKKYEIFFMTYFTGRRWGGGHGPLSPLGSTT